MSIDPGKIRNWGLIVASIVTGVLLVGNEVKTSRANDLHHDKAIEQINLNVEEITKMFKEDLERRDAAAVLEEDRRKRMLELCEEPAIREAKPIECALAKVGG